jgi:Protein of unknown function (DUF3106)
MIGKLQIAKWTTALSLCIALGLPVFAQRNQNRPPKFQQAARQQQKQEKQQRQQQRQERQAQREAQQNANRPPQSNPNAAHAPRSFDRPAGEGRPNNPNRPPNVYAPPPRAATPQERQKNAQQFSRLPQQQQQDIRDRARAWNQLTPAQRSHIKNEIAPKWQQLPPDRQRAIRSRLNVLKNMPESARDAHLNDPNFTRGMNEDDKAMLRDLTHMHVGGSPEAPND